jgi:hypothetical protein
MRLLSWLVNIPHVMEFALNSGAIIAAIGRVCKAIDEQEQPDDENILKILIAALGSSGTLQQKQLVQQYIICSGLLKYVCFCLYQCSLRDYSSIPLHMQFLDCLSLLAVQEYLFFDIDGGERSD